MKNVDFDVENILTKQEGEDLLFSLASDKDFSDSHKDSLRKNFFSTTFVPITLAFEPGRDFLTKVKSWFCQQMGKNVILDLKVEPKIVGGVIVVCNNHYRDYSVASEVDAILGRISEY